MTSNSPFSSIAGSRIRRGERALSPATLLDSVERGAPPWAPGDRIAVISQSGVDLLAAVLAIWASGGVPVLGASLPDLDDWRGTGTLWRWPGDRLREGPAGDLDTVVVHRTSGSTGKTKFARRSLPSLLQEAEGYRRCYGLHASDRAFVAAPIEHSFAFGAAFALMRAGAEIDLAARFSPRQLSARLDDGGTDVVILTPTMAQLAVQIPPGAGARRRVRRVIAGAGPVSDGLSRTFQTRFGVPIARNYGCSETGATLGLADHAGESVVGAPFAGVAIAAPAMGEIAELVLELQADILGYEDAAQRTRRWHSRDLATVDAAGRVTLHGRLDDRVKVGGRLVDLGAMGRAASTLPGVAAAVAVLCARPDRPETADLLLFCEGDAGLAPLIAAAAGRETGEVVIVRMLPALPRTAAGKPDRARLLEMLERLPATAGAGVG